MKAETSQLYLQLVVNYRHRDKLLVLCANSYWHKVCV